MGRKRYLEKLKVGGQELDDPFAISHDQWLDDLTKWPEFEFGDVYMYLIDSEGVYTRGKLKAYKSLDVYNYYYNGYVATYCLSLGYWRIERFKSKSKP